MPASLLTQQVDAWTLLTVGMSGFLVRFYRSLGDDKQASLALKVAGPAEERARRLGLNCLQAPTVPKEMAELEAEAFAWKALIEAQAGLYAFHAMVEDAPGLRGARSAASRAFRYAIQGLRVAFPDEMAEAHLLVAIESAARRCSDLVIQDLADSEDPVQEAESFRATLSQQIVEGLRAAV